MNKVILQVRVDEKTRKTLKSEALKRGQTMGNVIEELVASDTKGKKAAGK